MCRLFASHPQHILIPYIYLFQWQDSVKWPTGPPWSSSQAPLLTHQMMTDGLDFIDRFFRQTRSNGHQCQHCSQWSYHHDTIQYHQLQDVKRKSPWYINHLTSRTTVSPSCSNFIVLLTLMFLELISETNTLEVDWKLIGCIVAKKHWGHLSWISCYKVSNHWHVDFGVSSFSHNTKFSLSSMDGLEYLQVVHSGLEMATNYEGQEIADVKASTLVPLVL